MSLSLQVEDTLNDLYLYIGFSARVNKYTPFEVNNSELGIYNGLHNSSILNFDVAKLVTHYIKRYTLDKVSDTQYIIKLIDLKDDERMLKLSEMYDYYINNPDSYIDITPIQLLRQEDIGSIEQYEPYEILNTSSVSDMSE